MNIRIVTSALLLSMLAGCATYEPAPLDPVTLSSSLTGRRLNDAEIRETLNEIAPGQSWGGTYWTEAALLACAIRYKPDLNAFRLAILAAAADVEAARVAPGPTLSLTAEYALNSANSSPWIASLASDLALDRGGRRTGRINQAEARLAQARYEYEAALWQTRMDIRRALDDRAAAQMRLELLQQIDTLRHRQLDSLQAQLDAGAVSRLLVEQARADASSEQRLLTEANAAMSQSLVALAMAVGVDGTAIAAHPLQAETSLALLPASTTARLDRTEALLRRSEILMAMMEYDRAESALQRAVAEQYPQISIGPGYSWDQGITKLPFSLSLSFASLDQNRAAIHAAEQGRTLAGGRLEAAVQSVISTVEQTQTDYEAALQLIETVEQRSLPTAHALAEQSDAQLRAGSINRSDWAASQLGLLRAQLDLTDANITAMSRLRDLENALRSPLTGPFADEDTALFIQGY